MSDALLLELTNAARLRAGLAPLRADARVQGVAQQHAQAMAVEGFFDHVDAQRRAVGERLLAAGYNYRWAGENISAGKDSARAVFEWWLESAAHRANILKPEFTVCGFGHCHVAEDRLGFHHYWVQAFAAPLG